MWLIFFKKSARRETLSDSELLAAYRSQGDAAHVGVLFERYSLQIYVICKSYMKEEEAARDAAMEVFEYLLDQLQRYEIENFKNWLGRAVKNFCLMRIRKENTEGRKILNFRLDEKAVMENGSDEHLSPEMAEAETQALRAAILSLNEKQRTCIELFYLEKLSYEEVASRSGFTLKEVKSYIQNGKRNLRLILENKK